MVEPTIPKWLKSLPLAPEYHPTETEFADPIAFISRIEAAASAFGICKIVPPNTPRPPNRKLALSNLAPSLAPSFTTRHQQVGPARQQQVWQSGHSYTLPQFQSKSNQFARSRRLHNLPPFPLEALFWRSVSPSLPSSAADRPLSVEYANDVPGSGFGRGDRLSESRWNLQSIARAPGSLTRFMPDDVPGVTSPMVYVAMLFSWFAWHVEDHELHSLNFLHVGAPKTWYAVPGDRAAEFEEVIRVKGYGGNVDRLAAFMMLGEKTTLMSPEVVVASGIPCCRLVQNPGEFVVTFPRAYHVGFSHGFNCGEAANFATPQWLKVAKEAAVRRAAMNYLPMLSHQQLLYILTMSFVSRIPRSLLSGIRSSRLKDRKREEREILVKKAFLNDMMAENNLLCSLLLKESTSGAVLWEPDLLLSLCTVFQSHSSLSSEGQMSRDNDDDKGRKKEDDCVGKSLIASASDVPCQAISSIQVEKNACCSHSSTEELVEDLDDDEDDLPVGMRIDSGALACVACGILGYPFMAVVQLSESAGKEFFPVNYEQSQQNLGNSSCPSLPSFRPSSGCKFDQDKTRCKLVEQVTPVSSRKLSPECGGEGKGSRDGTELLNSDVQLPNLLHGQTSKSGHGFCRPRIFCLQHALEVEELLKGKGGANVLIICHSDYIKIKAYATPVAEEVGMQFNFKDVPLENASPSELDLIKIAISNEGHDEHDEDWTSKIGMNLAYSVKVRNQTASKQESMSVILGRMFSGNFPVSDFSTLKWHSRKSRTPYKVVGVSLSKSFIDVNIEKNESVVRNTNADSSVKLQVYESRKRKANAMAVKYFGQLGEGIQHDSCSSDVSGMVDCKEKYPNKKRDGNKSDEFFSVTVSAAEDVQTYEGSCIPVRASNADKIIDSCGSEICSPNVKVLAVDTSERHQEILSAEECGTWCNSGTSVKSESQANVVEPKATNIEGLQVTGAVVETNSAYEFDSTSYIESEIMDGKHCSSLLPVELCDNSEVQPYVLHVGQSSNVVERFSEEKFGTECKSLSSKKSESQGIVSEPETRLSDLQLGVGAADVNISQREFHNSTDSSCASRSLQSISISQEPDFVGSLGKPLLAYDNSEMQLEALGAEADNKEVNIDQSSKLERQLVSNSSTVSKCELQQVELPTLEENKVEDGDGNSRLKDSTSGTGMPVATSSQLHQEILSTNGGTKVACDNPEVDNSLENSAHVAISVAGKDETKTADSLKRHSGYLNSVVTKTYVRQRYKRKQEEQVAEVRHSCNSFFRSPCEGLRPRSGQIAASKSTDRKTVERLERKKATPSPAKRPRNDEDKKLYMCDVEGCRMTFRTKEEHRLHMQNRCTYRGCRKRFKSHKNTLQHRRVHLDERPLVCPWKGCGKSFKWAWARTEHIRLHTGERPYKCTVAGCELTFRFVSDFSRHRRSTGHTVNSG